MRYFLPVLFLAGWIAPAAGAAPLPAFLVGEWALPSAPRGHLVKFEDSGDVYLLADGRGAWQGGEAGLAGTATYGTATHVVTLVTSEKGGPTYTMTLLYAPAGKTLTVVKVRSDVRGEVPRVSTKLTLTRRTEKIPADVLDALDRS